MKIYIALVLSLGLISCAAQEQENQKEIVPVSADAQSSTDLVLDEQNEEFEIASGAVKSLRRCSALISQMDRNSRNFKRIKCGYPDGVSPGPLSGAPKSTTVKKCDQLEAIQIKKAISYLRVVKIDQVVDANCSALEFYDELNSRQLKIAKENDKKFDKLTNKDFLLYLN